jgi:O-antigen ligase
VTVLATTAAGLISLADFAGDATIRETPIAWIVAGPYSPLRLTGVIRSPTSTAALIMIPLAIYLTAMILGQDRRLRLVSVLASVPLLVAAYLTYNRAVFLALIVWLVIVGWRIRRALGIALFALALVGSLVFIPWYISARGAAVGPISQAPPGQVLIASDQMRLTAWEAAVRMFLDEPILGQGYRAYRQLAVEFGDPTLNAPHNEWLRFFAEHGFVVGLLAIAFAVATALALARRSDWLATGILIAFLATGLAASFNNPFLFNQVMIPAFVLAGCGLAMAERSARADAAPSAEFGSPLREVV